MKCSINKMEYRKGNETEAYAASISLNGKRVKIVYDAIGDCLIIHKWYCLTAKEREIVRSEMVEYFRLVKNLKKKLMSAEFSSNKKGVAANRRFYAIYSGYPDEIAVFQTAKSRDEWVKDGEESEVKRIALPINHLRAILGSFSDHSIDELICDDLSDSCGTYIGWIAF